MLDLAHMSITGQGQRQSCRLLQLSKQLVYKLASNQLLISPFITLLTWLQSQVRRDPCAAHKTEYQLNIAALLSHLYPIQKPPRKPQVDTHNEGKKIATSHIHIALEEVMDTVMHHSPQHFNHLSTILYFNKKNMSDKKNI